MKLKKMMALMLPALLSMSLISEACTSLAINDLKGNVYHGRTLELTENMPSWLTFYPKGTHFQKIDPNGKPAANYNAKYDILAITTMVYNDGNDHNVLEGINSAGLSFSANMITSAVLNPLTPEEASKSIPVTSIGEWTLANYATVDEVKQAINENHFWAPLLKALGNVKSPFHYVFYDKKGGSIVVEAKDGKLQVCDNPTKVMTNGPDFPWHLQNLNNFTQLTNVDRSAAVLGNMQVVQPDSGIASSDLPSSDTSVGRFIRGVYYTSYAPKSNSSAQTINTLAHVMNRFDRLKNITTDTLGGETSGSSKPKKVAVSEYTVWTNMADLSNGDLYVRGYNDTNYTKYSISQYKNSAKPVFIPINLPIK